MGFVLDWLFRNLGVYPGGYKLPWSILPVVVKFGFFKIKSAKLDRGTLMGHPKLSVKIGQVVKTRHERYPADLLIRLQQ